MVLLCVVVVVVAKDVYKYISQEYVRECFPRLISPFYYSKLRGFEGD